MDGQKLSINPANIHAQVYAQNAKGVMYVKVHFADLNLYINSFTVRPSPRYAEKGKLWVQPPKFAIYGKWVTVLEFVNGAALWSLIEEEIEREVDRYQRDNAMPDDLSLEIPP